MSDSVPSEASFAYIAQDSAGTPLVGTIESPTIDSAARTLNELRLRVTRLTPATPRRRARLSSSEFALINQQLAYLTGSNLPVEKGLRLLADEMGSARVAPTLHAVAADLEAGVPLDEALERRHGQFPPLYAAIVHAGLASGSLPGALLNLNRHIELVTRLRSAIWRAVAYPLLLVGMLLIVLTFIGHYIVPQFDRMMSGHWRREPSAISQFVFSIAKSMPTVLLCLVGIFVSALFVGLLLRVIRPRGAGGDLLLWMPLAGGILRQNLLARWCDALGLTTAAGIALPQAVLMTGQMVGSPLLQRDSDALAVALNAGEPLDSPRVRARLLSPVILDTAQLAAEQGDLPRALGVLSTMYQQGADMRLNLLPGTLTPVLIVIIAAIMFLVILGLFQPLISIY